MNILNRIYYRFLTPEKYARKVGVKIGENCDIQTRYFGSEPYLIEIGNHVQITSGVKFFTHGGSWVFRDEYPNFDTFGKIIIGNNVYIGNDVMIMPGVRIPNDCIIGAGAVVTKSFDENGIILTGIPAKKTGTLHELKLKLLTFNVESKQMTGKEKKDFLLKLPIEKFIKK